MPPTAKVAELPADVREELDALIVEKGFGDYAGLADWLSGRGHPMHKATVARHGKRLRRRIERMRDSGARAAALAAEAPPDFGVVADAALAEVQARLLDSLLEGDVGALKDLAAAARALAHVVRAAALVSGERKRVRAEAVPSRRDRKLSMEAVRRIRREVYGLADDTGFADEDPESSPPRSAPVADSRT